MPYQAIGRTPVGAYNPYSSPPIGVGGRIGTLSVNPAQPPATITPTPPGTLTSSIPRPTVSSASPLSTVLTTPPTSDTDILVSGAGTLATGYGAYQYSLAKLAEKAAAETIEPGTISKLKFGMTNLMGAARTSALLAGAVSTVQNIVSAFNGTETGTRAIGNISADAGGAFGIGMAAAGAAGMVTTAMAAGLGATAVGLIGAGVGAGIYFGLDYLYRSTGIHKFVSDTITNFLDSLFGTSNTGGHGGM